MIFKTFQFRIKDSNQKKELSRMAGSVNYVWNYLNETSAKAWKTRHKWLSAYELEKLTAGSCQMLGISGDCISLICQSFCNSRNKTKRCSLGWRSSKRKLGWIPLKGRDFKQIEDSLIYRKLKYKFWKSREIEGKIKTGSFNQDAKGNWFINLTCEMQPEKETQSTKTIGIDLGLKALATTSDGEIIENPRAYQTLEKDLAKAQRARKKRRIKAIHAKIKNVRKDYLHKVSTRLVRENKQIFIGDVSSLKLKKTRFAKSVSDSGWGLFKTMLAYKAIRFGVDLKIVNEKYSSVTCSICNERSGPNGLSALGVREWACSNCGESHNRDVNAAKNILAFGLRHKTLLEESRC